MHLVVQYSEHQSTRCGGRLQQAIALNKDMQHYMTCPSTFTSQQQPAYININLAILSSNSQALVYRNLYRASDHRVYGGLLRARDQLAQLRC